jgi:hypothetical protein
MTFLGDRRKKASIMSNESLIEKWEELSSSANTENGIRRLKLIPDSLGIYAGWEYPENLPVLIVQVPIEDFPDSIDLPESVGFEIDKLDTGSGENLSKRLILKIRDSGYLDVYKVLAQDIYEHLKTAGTNTELVRILIAQLYRWQEFLKRHKTSRLSRSLITGLWGELWFFLSVLLPKLEPDMAVAAWQGPGGSSQDFEFSGKAVEVKTTTSNPHEKLFISNLRQLEPTGLDDLYLHHQAVVIHRGAGQTLPSLISDIRQALNSFPGALNTFNEKVFNYGYIDSEADHYEEEGFTALHNGTYKVEEGFPRLIQDEIPDGVGDVKYSIVLNACHDFQVNIDDIF